MKERSLKIFYALIPLVFWLVVLSLPLLSNLEHMPQPLKVQRTSNIIKTNCLLIFIFYIHHYFIYPLKNKKNGTLLYAITILVCLGLYMQINYYIHKQPINIVLPMNGQMLRPPVPNFFMSILPFSFVMVSGFCYQQYLDKINREKLIKELENVQLKTELAFLSSQMEPHFIFNVLNTLVSMARKKSDLLETSLINLSQLIRYMLHNNDNQTIYLSDEIDYVKSYIDLQMLRYEGDVKLNLHLAGDFSGIQIEPMLLIPFIENAFKHGIGYIKDPIIDISIILDNEKKALKIMVVNSAHSVSSIIKKGNGIGLTNVKRRLQLLYPNKHLFHIEKKNDTFIVLLQILLNDELHNN